MNYYLPPAPTRKVSEYITEEQIRELLPLAGYTGLEDTEIACKLYEAIRERELASPNGSFHFQFVLGELFFLGKICGVREARAKRRRSAA